MTLGFCVTGVIHREEHQSMRHPRALWTELIMELAAFSVLIASVALLWRNNLLLFIVALVECLMALALWHDRLDVSFLLVIALLGSLAEAIFVRFGAWYYTNPTLLGVPLWFPLAFGTTGLIGGRLAQTLTGLWEKVCSSPGSE
jgi:uncharacterized membrane protein YoaT (DUF817 family)